VSSSFCSTGLFLFSSGLSVVVQGLGRALTSLTRTGGAVLASSDSLDLSKFRVSLLIVSGPGLKMVILGAEASVVLAGDLFFDGL